jgi:CspA family cold shock protein
MGTPTRHGRIKFFDAKRGYGFVTLDDGGGDVFFHISQVVAMEEPQKGQHVVFRLGRGRDGRPQAQHVSPAE